MRELELRDANADLSPERYKELLLLKYEDEDLADRMAAKYALGLIKAGVIKE